MPSSFDEAKQPEVPTWLARTVTLLAYARHNPTRIVVPLIATAALSLVAWRIAAPARSTDLPENALPLAQAASTRPVPAASAERVIAVHLAGAVARPGVLALPDGSRVVDAVAAAGGPAPDADIGVVNLAARLVDGTRIYVPRVGEAVTAESAAAGGAGPAAPLNLNSATVDQLDGLPGVGPATATAIVTYRRDHGPFRSVDELVAIRGIGPAKLEELRSLVTV